MELYYIFYECVGNFSDLTGFFADFAFIFVFPGNILNSAALEKLPDLRSRDLEVAVGNKLFIRDYELGYPAAEV